jgi:hypothetical protein
MGESNLVPSGAIVDKRLRAKEFFEHADLPGGAAGRSRTSLQIN